VYIYICCLKDQQRQQGNDVPQMIFKNLLFKARELNLKEEEEGRGVDR